MLNNIIDKNIVFLQKHGVKMNIDDDKAVYKYGLQILYYYVIDLVVIFSLAHLFGRLYETVIMVAIFGLLQVFGGGYHAKTPLKCLVTMLISLAVGNILITFMSDMLAINLVIVVYSMSIILILTPVTNKKHPVSKKIKQRSKIIVRVIAILTLAAVLILSYFNKNIEIATIAVILALYAVSLITVKIKTNLE
ncbi:MAG: accessory gene regulator B family protein [Treponema sp.]|nr:accessory gene regulator B family protein [Treponema sp.]